MVEFDLSEAHPDYKRDIPAILELLMGLYPAAELRSVKLYQPKSGDTSMGATYPGGEIRLNSYWFTSEPTQLSESALHHTIVDVGGVQMGWHGPMVWEPRQLLTHEFGHVIWQALPKRQVEEWAGDRWREATRNPRLAPSAYALAGNPPAEEFFGEMFALVHLGFATDAQVADMDDLIGRLR
jgi:hypothetical protein